jgi:hypothetical protein
MVTVVRCALCGGLKNEGRKIEICDVRGSFLLEQEFQLSNSKQVCSCLRLARDEHILIW